MTETAALLLKIVRMIAECDAPDQQRIVQYLVSEFGLPAGVTSRAMTPAERAARYRQSRRDETVTDAVTESVTETVTEDRDGQQYVVPVVASNGSNNRQLQQEARSLLQFLNEKTGKSYRAVETNLTLIKSCLKSGATLDDCRGVIARKVRAWKGTDMEKYLRPATLFNRVKFEQYIGEQPNA